VNKFFYIVLLVIGASLCGCTVIPKPIYIVNTQPSFDSSTPTTEQTNQNSGFIGFLKNGNGIITQNALDRYNNLIDKFSQMVLNETGYKIKKDSGISPIQGNNKLYEIDKQHLFYFIIMNQWNKQDRINNQ
jgi:hypothetical protein